MRHYGAFCELYGKTVRNLVLSYILSHNTLEFTAGEIAEDAEISRAKAYEYTHMFVKKAFIKKTRKLAGTQLYQINEKSKDMQQLQRDFKDVLKRIKEKN